MPASLIRKRSAIVTVAALILFALALALGAVYLNKQNEADRSREFTAKLAHAHSALSRGDFSAAERALVVLAAAYPDHPAVLDLRQELDRRVREQEARREQLREATLKAARVLGLADPVPAPAQAPAADPPKSECSATLAALALCER
jgi:uncharacterized protein HemX